MSFVNIRAYKCIYTSEKLNSQVLPFSITIFLFYLIAERYINFFNDYKKKFCFIYVYTYRITHYKIVLKNNRIISKVTVSKCILYID